MWGVQSSGGPGSRGGSWRRRRASQGVQSSLLREGIVNLLRERRRRHKLRTGVENSLVLLWFL